MSYSICKFCGGLEDYDKANKKWFCPDCSASPEEAAIKAVPRKFRKLVESGRWRYITKGDVNVGVERKSNGEERWF